MDRFRHWHSVLLSFLLQIFYFTMSFREISDIRAISSFIIVKLFFKSSLPFFGRSSFLAKLGQDLTKSSTRLIYIFTFASCNSLIWRSYARLRTRREVRIFSMGIQRKDLFLSQFLNTIRGITRLRPLNKSFATRNLREIAYPCRTYFGKHTVRRIIAGHCLTLLFGPRFLRLHENREGLDSRHAGNVINLTSI